jgi:hypothetical protein
VPWFTFAIAESGLVLLCLYQSWPGLAPPGIWLDDLWVSVLARSASLGELIDFHPPVPPGFIILLKASSALFGDGHWQLQLPALVCRLAAIPIVGWLAFRITLRLSAALVASALLADIPFMASLAIRAKQYTLDALVVTGVMLLGTTSVQQRTRRAFTSLTIAAALAAFVSHPGVIAGVLVVNSAFWSLETNERTWRALLTWIGYHVLVSVVCLVVLRNQQQAKLAAYWNAYFVPLSSAAALREFFLAGSGHGWRFLSGAFPLHSWQLVLVVPGLAWLLTRGIERPIGVVSIALFAIVLLLSAFKLYPVGEPRTDAFSYPVAVVLAAVGVHCLVGRIPGALPLAAAASLMLAASDSLQHRASYPPAGEKVLVDALREVLRPADALVVHPWGSWALGYYGPWPIDLVKVSDSAAGFCVHPRRDHTLVLAESYDGQSFPDPAAVEPQLQQLLQEPFPRVVYFGDQARLAEHEAIARSIARHGYVVRRMESTRTGTGRGLAAALVVLERAETAAPRGTPVIGIPVTGFRGAPGTLEAVVSSSFSFAAQAADDSSHVVTECRQSSCHLADVNRADVDFAQHDVRSDVEDSLAPMSAVFATETLLSPQDTS